MALVSAMPAARETEVGVDPPGGALAPILSTLMMRPHLRSRMAGSASRESRMAAKSFRSRSSCQSASVTSRKPPRWDVPALLIRISTWPRPFTAAA